MDDSGGVIGVDNIPAARKGEGILHLSGVIPQRKRQ
jgi:hypothetical protein